MNSTPSNQRKTDDVDRIIAGNIRRLRRGKEMSQGDLGKSMGVTFQQVQKYEKATNRISAAHLYYAAKALGVSVGSLFDGA